MLYNKQYKWQDDLIHNVGLSFFKKDWVIKQIVYHPLKFAKRRMEDPLDDRPIRIRYFATFVLKSLKTKALIAKYKEIYRNPDKYKPILKEMGYEVEPLSRYRKGLSFIVNKHTALIDEIYDKGHVTNETPPIL